MPRPSEETLIRKYGGTLEEAYEKWKAEMRINASIGGKNGTTGGFYANRDLAREAGRVGGRISRRRKT